MKEKKFLSFALLAVMLVAVSLPGLAQTEKDILENMIKALGGRDTLAAIKDTRISGTMEIIQYGMNAPFTLYQKEPDKFRMEMEVVGMSMIQVYDGQKAMMTNPQTGEIIELAPDQSEQLRKQALGNSATLHPEKYGITYTYKGKEEVDGKTCHVLEQKYPSGDAATLYLDAATYLPYKSKSKSLSPSGGEMESMQVMSDYRKVNGTMVAFSMTIYQSGVESIRMTINEVVYNTGLDDSLFVLK
ncbi:MAG: outer membrane lipoprotein-sorting protein [Candidatus Saccharicenans sp.]|nr:outer membrane lipoprotein-sorting protein [Candidatus Saccharicenans sp.]MDI6848650.1 outer membrane lipoprotein-sorting protein [Candidatus Saccharicenans sp.]